MRLSDKERLAIRDSVRRIDEDAIVYLFGSRADDTARGGDIDLLIFSRRIDFGQRRKLKLRLYDALGEQKIDVVVADDMSQPFTRIAMATGVRI